MDPRPARPFQARDRRRPGRLARGLGRAAVGEEMALVVGGRGQPRTVSWAHGRTTRHTLCPCPFAQRC